MDTITVPSRTTDPSTDDGTVLGVVPVPGTDTALVIVGYLMSAAPVPAPEPQHQKPQDDLVVDRETRTVRLEGKPIDLTYREFELLDYLSAAPGRVYNRRQLMAAVWDRYSGEHARTVDVHILRIRRKLGRHASRIVTVRNVGYKYVPPRP
ncbi:winged helix-turn-helix domain-containing protein [Acrocarpospora catenulata]|uniref:winged helix-turn-helix domain-containing protein n=1 Tax=Acrocarpospora catenulata TaxID=2836182 RepID=UPI001BDA5A39|nr:winged helix-turn-helix domain-containing protein [Acrocarpospora catenulata]